MTEDLSTADERSIARKNRHDRRVALRDLLVAYGWRTSDVRSFTIIDGKMTTAVYESDVNDGTRFAYSIATVPLTGEELRQLGVFFKRLGFDPANVRSVVYDGTSIRIYMFATHDGNPINVTDHNGDTTLAIYEVNLLTGEEDLDQTAFMENFVSGEPLAAPRSAFGQNL